MHRFTTRFLLAGIACFLAISLAATASAQTQTLRIVTYNIEDDTPGIETPSFIVPRPGLIQPADGSGNYSGSVSDGGVLEGIGEEKLGANNNIQPLDILLLEETTSNTTTIDPIVSALNTYYGTPGKYARSSVQGSQAGSNGFGNGPNAMVYNTQAVQLVASVGVGFPGGSGNGEYRQVMRYEFAPAGTTPAASNEFYIYVSHYKSGGSASDQTARQGEATIIRNDSATLPSNSRILYVGDYNLASSTEASYQTIVGAGINQGVDPLNPSGSTGVVWSTNANNNQKTESATFLSSRDDFQIMTNNVYSGTAGGLSLVSNTYHSFGNNGTTNYHGTTNSAGNTSLNGVVVDGGTFISASQLKQDLSFAADHLPVVADYTIPVPEPSTVVLLGIGGMFLAFRARAFRRRLR